MNKKDRLPKDEYFIKRLLEIRPDIDQLPNPDRSIIAPQETIEDAKGYLLREGASGVSIAILLATIADQYYLVPKKK
jgi:hypothetical protein